MRDESDRNGLKITIDLKRGTNVELLMHKLFAMTPLSDSFSCNFNVLIHGKPMTLGVGEIFEALDGLPHGFHPQTACI